MQNVPSLLAQSLSRVDDALASAQEGIRRLHEMRLGAYWARWLRGVDQIEELLELAHTHVATLQRARAELEQGLELGG